MFLKKQQLVLNIILAISIIAFAVALFIVAPDYLCLQKYIEPQKTDTTLTPYEVANQIENLRAERKLRRITDLENTLNANFAQDGIYAYACPGDVDYAVLVKKEDIELVKDFDNFKVELHKFNNNLYVVGYVSEEDYLKIKKKNRKESINFCLFNIPNKKAQRLVSMPLRELLNFKDRDYKNNIVVDVRLR